MQLNRDKIEEVTNSKFLSASGGEGKAFIELKCKVTAHLYNLSLPMMPELGNGTAKAGVLQEVGNWVRANNFDIFYRYLSKALEGDGAIKYIGDKPLFPRDVIHGEQKIKLPILKAT